MHALADHNAKTGPRSETNNSNRNKVSSIENISNHLENTNKMVSDDSNGPVTATPNAAREKPKDANRPPTLFALLDSAIGADPTAATAASVDEKEAKQIDKSTNPKTSSSSSDETRDSFESAQKLLFATREPAACLELVTEGTNTVARIIQAIVDDRKKFGEKGSPSLQVALVHILLNMASAGVDSAKIAAAVGKGGLNDDKIRASLLSAKDDTTVASIVDLIGQALAADLVHYNKKVNGYTRSFSDIQIALILKDLSSKLEAEKFSEKVRIAALNSMIRIADRDFNICKAISTSPDFAVGLKLASDESVQIRSILPIALTTFLCSASTLQSEDNASNTLPEGFVEQVQQNIYGIVTKWLTEAGGVLRDSGLTAEEMKAKSAAEKAELESDLICKLHKIQIQALKALNVVFIASPTIAGRFLMDEQFCKDLAKLSNGYDISEFIAQVTNNGSQDPTDKEVANLLSKDSKIILSRKKLDLALLECYSTSVTNNKKLQKELLESEALKLMKHYVNDSTALTATTSATTNNKKKPAAIKKMIAANNKTTESKENESSEKQDLSRRLTNLSSVILIKCSFVAKQLQLPKLYPEDKLADVFIESLVLAGKDLEIANKNSGATKSEVGQQRTQSAYAQEVRASELNVQKGISGAVEGLAYLSTQSEVKVKISENTELLKAFTKFLLPTSDKLLYFGICSIIQNVVGYRKIKSQEEKMRKKLADMASGTEQVAEKSTLPDDDKDPLMQDDKVRLRGDAVIKAGLISSLTSCLNSAQNSGSRTSRLNAVVCEILLNLARENRNRGTIAQQGGIKVLIEMLASEPPRDKGGCATDATLALARISIGLDPTIAFTQTRILGLIKPFSLLLESDNLLEEFESLMALTNFASMQQPQIFAKLRSCSVTESAENLQFSSNVMVSRAATEFICNMVFDPETFMKYADRLPEAHKLKILAALSDSEDQPTRRAASGALAILTDHPNASLSLALEERAMNIVVGLVTLDPETNEEIHARGLALVGNLLRAYGAAKQEKETDSQALVAKAADSSVADSEKKEKSLFSDERYLKIKDLLLDAGLMASLTQLMAQSPAQEIRAGAKDLLASLKQL